MFKGLVLALLVATMGCTQVPQRYGPDLKNYRLPNQPSPTIQFGTQDIPAKVGSASATINIVSEHVLRPVGMEKIGIFLFDFSGAVGNGIILPADKLRRFELGKAYHGSVELDVGKNLDEVSVGISIRF